MHGKPYGRICALFCLLLFSSAGPARSDLARVLVTGDAPVNGIFDPSVEYAPGSGEGWLSYSAVFGDLVPWGPHVETHLARSVDGGETWSFVGVVNPSTAALLQLSGGETLSGVWNYEVSSLVYDPSDAGAEWKLFAHRIFRKDEDDFTTEQSLPAYSWLILRTAPHPSGPWSPEVALLSSGPLPPAPYDQVAVAINELDPSLAGLLVYSEPGAFERDGVLYLSLTGLTASGADRILLLASDTHGASWRYVGTPLSNSDAAPLGYLSFDGSAIAEDRGRVFLLTTPESPGVLHDGTLVFEFESLEAGRLVRNGGVPVVHGLLPAQAGFPVERRGGQADFHEGNAVGGVLQPALHVEELPELFQFSSTGVPIVETLALPGLGAVGRAALAPLLALVVYLARERRATRAKPRARSHGERSPSSA